MVTTAINMAHEVTETEVDRQFKKLQITSSHHLDRVTLRGEITLNNFETVARRVVIDVPVLGRPLSATADGATQDDRG